MSRLVLIFVIVLIGSMALACIAYLSIAQNALGRLETTNPLIDNEGLKQFVSTKPMVQNDGHIYDIHGMLGVVNAALGVYELSALKSMGGAKDLRARLFTNEGTLILLGQPFTAKFVKEVTLDDERVYYVFGLKRIDGYDLGSVANLPTHKLFRMHVLVA